MKRICAAIAIAAALLTIGPAAGAQKFIPAHVEVSKSTVDIEGRTFYVHTVEARQTLYSICKAYDADLDEVKEINAERLTGGLKTGSLLLIPADKKVAESKTEPRTVAAEPARQVQEAPAEQPRQEVKYIYHRVKWYDSLLMLSLKYKVSQEDIVELNNLDSKTLVVGQILKIPVRGDVDSDIIDDNTMVEVPEEGDFEEDDDTDTEVTIIDQEEPEQDWNWKPVYVPFNGTANIALIIPIGSKTSSPSGNFLDFYGGMLMAIEDARKDGTNVNLKVIDMTDFSSAEQLMQESRLENFDFLIGNFSMENIETPAHWCDIHHIPLISPLDQKVEAATYNHPYLINVQLASSTQTMRMAESIGFRPGKDNVVVLADSGENQSKFHSEITASLDSLHIPYTIAKTSSGHILENLRNTLIQGKRNHVIITSERESLAGDAVRTLGNLSRAGTYEIVGYASHKIRKFESIEADSYQKMNAHFSMGHYVDYSDEDAREFVRRYRALYNADPGNFGFQGYDVGAYFIDALKRYGNDMINGIGRYYHEGMQLNFRFDRRNSFGGMFNEATKNLVY
ncbi:MAG: LysM peptidoglycan-binding domain-containing protein [Bacteroidales bacterium]|nr:LysM peptidoglycan-binding domain-containing protein [Bacteroidales bacterium]